MWASGVFLRAVALLYMCFAAFASATPGCTTIIDSSSHMFGGGLRSPLQDTWVSYTQETQWKSKGDITKINVYYDSSSSCLKGIKATFGYKAGDADRIGTEKTPDGFRQYETLDLQLQGSEIFTRADYKYNDQCVEYLKLYTNRDRTLAIGNSQSSSPLLSTRPVATKGTFLAFFKGYTDVANTNARTGQLQQLQLVWAVRICGGASQPPVSNPNPSAPPISNPNPSAPPTSNPNPSAPPTSNPNPSAPPTTDVSPPSSSPSPPVPSPPAAKCSPASKFGCNEGRCPASACPLTGMGLEVPMLCYGVNKQVLPLQQYLKPCTNLACKLDKPSCTSFGVLGVGSYCTGTVVAMAEEAELHPIGKLMVGYPCIEHTGPLLDIVPAFTSAENKGLYIAKAWKTCDCLQGVSAVIKAMIAKDTALVKGALAIPDGSFLSKIFNVTLPDCNIETMVKQWVSAAAIKLPLPKVEVSDSKIEALKALIPDFQIPSLVLPDISVPLLKLPEELKSLPVVKIHASAAAAVSELLNVTTLVTFLTPTNPASTFKAIVDSLTLPDLTIDGIKELAATYQAAAAQAINMEGLSTLLNLAPANMLSLLKPNITLGKLDVTAVISQWVAANAVDLPIPMLQIGAMKNAALKVLIPGFKMPSMVVHEAAKAFVQAHEDLPLFVIHNAVLKGVGQLLPNITSLATILVDKDVKTILPTLKIGDVTIPNFTDVAFKLSASLLPNITIPGLPSALPLLNIQSVNLNGLIAFFDNLDELFTSEATPGVLEKLRSTLGDVASALLPDSIEASLEGFSEDAAAAWQQVQAAFS